MHKPGDPASPPPLHPGDPASPPPPLHLGNPIPGLEPLRYEYQLCRQVKGLAPAGSTEDFEFEEVLQLVPVFDVEKHDKYIEEMIKKRILENDFDDPKRPPKVQVIDQAASASSEISNEQIEEKGKTEKKGMTEKKEKKRKTEKKGKTKKNT